MKTRQLIEFENTRRERRWLEKNHPLRQLFWECTLRCNLSCRHCGSDCRKVSLTPDMPLEHFLPVLDDVATMIEPGRVLVNTVGGEPLVRPDIVECGKAITDRGFMWGFVTNGVLLTEKMLRDVLKAGLRTVAVSLDGLENEHNWLRGGSFDGAMAAVKLLTRTRNLLWDVITCVNQRNFSTLPELKQYLLDAGVTKWRIFTIFPQGRAKLNNELFLNPEQYVELMDFIASTRKEGKIDLSYSCEGFLGDYEGEVRSHIYRCDAGTMTASILANGDISGCLSIRSHYNQGNIYRDKFSDVWKNRFEQMRNRRWMKRDECAKCKVWDWCAGGPFHLRDDDGKMLHCNYLTICEAKK
ncbi:MAG: TIGR04133 family radical SAM/SPASM protein [Muribaculaceae bacterium]|nr:TIGR04133 family radical SAM/SPASM protein [Muribaculaceae bacterium]MBR5117327.1 TIGR04133 family radical SAM/SPASM protein [Muribaculaceae bacterium]